jgi:hypothetical protein
MANEVAEQLGLGTETFVSAFHPIAAQRQTWLKFEEGSSVDLNPF